MDPDIARFRSKLLEYLREGPTRVVFTKKDLTKRIMYCTLAPSLLPEMPAVEINEEKVPRKKNENQCRVYDLEKKEWRSFNYNSVDVFEKAPLY